MYSENDYVGAVHVYQYNGSLKDAFRDRIDNPNDQQPDENFGDSVSLSLMELF